MKTTFSTLMIILLWIGTVALSIWRVNPPSADESCSIFQSMLKNVERFTINERWVGSPELTEVRDKIIAEIEEMGITPVIHSTKYTFEDIFEAMCQVHALHNYEKTTRESKRDFDLWSSSWHYSIERFFPEHPLDYQGYMYIDNIWVTLESQNPYAGGMMFVSHLDSAINSPGAADAMVHVTAMLEAMRIHANNPNLQNNLHFLFTDGEELYSLGALAFSKDFLEVSKNVDMLINLESIGNSGGLVNFQTSDKPFNIVRLYNKVAPKPIGFHWGDWVYRTFMPWFWTDFTFLREYGFRGMNFAILGGQEHYHRPTDTHYNLNRNTAWHILGTVLSLSTYAANNSLEIFHKPPQEAVFFPFLPTMKMVVMTVTTANILTVSAFVVAVLFMFYRFKAKIKNADFITIFVGVLVIITILIMIFANPISYLFWLPLLVISMAAFLIKKPVLYRYAMNVANMIILLLWTPPIYLMYSLLPKT